ncbi:hypothetical protein [Funiculus sociatus]
MFLNAYTQIIKDNRTFMEDLVGYIYPGTILEFPTANLNSKTLIFDSMVKSASGETVAIINSSVRLTSCGRFTSAIIDESKADALLRLAHIAPVMVAGLYKSDGTLDLYRLDEDGALNHTAIRTEKHTPVSYVNQQKVLRRLIEIPFSSCWMFSYQQRCVKLQQR